MHNTFAKLYVEHFDSTVSKYRRAMETCGYKSLVVHSGHARKKSSFDDQYWPVKTTPTLAHFLPIQEEGGCLVINEKKVTYIRGQEKSFWESPRHMEAPYCWEKIDLKICPGNKITKELPQNRVALIKDDRCSIDSWGYNPEQTNPVSLIEKLHAIRAIKTPYEIACIAEANRKASFGHEAIRSLFMEGCNSEVRLLGRYLETTEQDGDQTPYKSIVALGKHAAILHHVQYASHAGEQETSLLVDAGATCMGYASDITRTYVRGDSHTATAFKSLISKILGLQDKILDDTAIGVKYESLHEKAHLYLAQILVDCDLVFGSVDSIIEKGITQAFFPHGLGHSLGIQTHDVGCKMTSPKPQNPHLRTTVTLKKGHVMTIEPGCYFINALLDPIANSPLKNMINWVQVDQLATMGGIRIEDNVALEEHNLSNLTRDNWLKNS